jgi:molecular chaperone DnaJ
MQLSMSGKGNEAPGGGMAGDLLILIEEKEDENLKRDGNNVMYDLYLNFVDAALGSDAEVPTIGGKVKIKIEPGTQGGKILRLRGKGIKDINGYGKGDQLIHINVWTPKKLTAEEKATLEALKSSPNFKPQPAQHDKGFFDRMREFFSH